MFSISIYGFWLTLRYRQTVLVLLLIFIITLIKMVGITRIHTKHTTICETVFKIESTRLIAANIIQWAKEKRGKWTMIHKTLHRQLKIEQYQSHLVCYGKVGSSYRLTRIHTKHTNICETVFKVESTEINSR
jgi:hypothetical protein